MDVELRQFEKDLLASVIDMKASRSFRVSEILPQQIQECVDADASSPATHHKSVPLKLGNSDT